jgi:PBP1b-binding outer membrane lipoprotein LpoB
MNFRKTILFLSLIALFFVGCSESEVQPKCTTKAITYQEFKDYQEKQNTKFANDKEVKKSDTVWKTKKQ